MTHEIWHIICGSAGTPTAEKTIVVYDAPFSVAIKIDEQALEAQAVAAGMDPQQVKKRLERFVNMVESDWYRWADFLEERLCIDYTRHDPHPQNFDH